MQIVFVLSGNEYEGQPINLWVHLPLPEPSFWKILEPPGDLNSNGVSLWTLDTTVINCASCCQVTRFFNIKRQFPSRI
jgi:hypothetical protein